MNRILIRYMGGYGDGGDTEDNETRESIESDAIAVSAICFENDGGDADTIQFRSCYCLLFFFFFFYQSFAATGVRSGRMGE